MVGLGGAALVGLAGAYATVPHVARRIKRFLDPASGDTFQVDTAVEFFYRGGWFGRGPGEGTVKRILPDSHADFVFAVAAEEFGIVLCLVLVALFAFIVLRALCQGAAQRGSVCAVRDRGACHLVRRPVGHQHGGQSRTWCPAKGMTLPFISYGGSSMISLAYGMGMLLAFTRERPRTALLPSRDGHRHGGEHGLMADRGPPLIVVAAGGTGGHLFPAEALALALKRAASRSISSPTSASAAMAPFRAAPPTSLPSATFVGTNPLAIATAAARQARPRRDRRGSRCWAALRPAAVVGFGGYPTDSAGARRARCGASRP